MAGVSKSNRYFKSITEMEKYATVMEKPVKMMRKPVKVMECIRQGQVGGGETHMLSLIENMDRSRFEPVVLSFTDGPMVTRLREMGVRTHIIHTERPFDFSKWARVKDLLQQEEVEVVHAHGTRACSNVMWASQSLGLPVVYTVHGWSFHPGQSPLVRQIRMMGEQYLTGRAAVNISVSASNRQTGTRHIRNFNSLVINNGIDRNKFDPYKAFKGIRQELGIPANAMLVVSIARFTSHKQPLTLIKAFQSALSGLPDGHLLLVGDGDQKAEALKMVDVAGLNERIHFQPFRQDVPDILAAADVFVLPSLWEGLPIGLLEAMAMGKAVIATDVDGTKEVVKDGYNGLLIEAGNAGALAKALVQLCNDEALRKQFSRASMETVRADYEAGGMTRKIEEVYCSIIKR
jgi:glycosyltransferase involved in cell wall biosynthesis